MKPSTVTIGIIDSGFDNLSIIRSKTFLEYSKGKQNRSMHGEVCARIISNYYSSLDFVVAEVIDKSKKTTLNCVISAMFWMLKQPVDIVLVSLGCKESACLQELEMLKNEWLERNIPVVVPFKLHNDLENGIALHCASVVVDCCDTMPLGSYTVIEKPEIETNICYIKLPRRQKFADEQGTCHQISGPSYAAAAMAGILAKLLTLLKPSCRDISSIMAELKKNNVSS